MTTSQMKCFITVADCLSFTKAADQLYITQSALSKLIKKMEEELNLQLFVRTSNGIRLTPAGSVLYVGLSDMYSNYIGLVEKSQKAQEGLSGSLRIGILDQMQVADFMPDLCQYFKNIYPNVDLTFTDGSFKNLLMELYAGRLDMIFTLQFYVAKKENVIYQYVVRSVDSIVMNKKHPLAQRDIVTIDDVKDETFIMISDEDNPESTSLIYEICKQHGFTPSIITAKTLAELILLVEVGLGVSILDTRCKVQLNPEIKCYDMPSNWDPSLVIAWNQNNYNPMISVFLKKLNEVLDLEGEDIYGVSLGNS